MSAGRFFAIFFAVYMVVAIAVNVLWGPPGMSADYLDQYEADHERYIQIKKSEGYARYRQRPDMDLVAQAYEKFPGLDPPLSELPEAVAFMDAYTARPAYKEQMRRRAIYDGIFEVYNFAAVVFLIVWFGRKPLLAFLDEQIETVRRKIDRAENAEAKATDRRERAKCKVDGLDDEIARIEAQARTMADQDRENIEEMKRAALEQLDQEVEERKAVEERRAAAQIRGELVEQAVQQLTEDLKRQARPARQSALIRRFASELSESNAGGANHG
jgi:F-type H+-transporting ATPase subunit b